MTEATSTISKAVSRIDAFFRRKPKAPPVAAPREPAPAHAHVNDIQTWPWMALHDPRETPLGPLTRQAQTGSHGAWQLFLGADGFRVSGNTVPDTAVTIGGFLSGRLPGIRITAGIDVHRLAGEDALTGLVFAASETDRAILACTGDGQILVFVLRSTGVELLHHTPLPPPPPGQATSLILQAMLFGGEALLFANGNFVGSVKDDELVGESVGLAVQVKGDADVTLRSLTVDGLDPQRTGK